MLLAEWTLELEERFPGIYKDFPNIKVTVTGLDMIQQNNESPVLVKLKHKKNQCLPPGPLKINFYNNFSIFRDVMRICISIL